MGSFDTLIVRNRKRDKVVAFSETWSRASIPWGNMLCTFKGLNSFEFDLFDSLVKSHGKRINEIKVRVSASQEAGLKTQLQAMVLSAHLGTPVCKSLQMKASY